MTKYAGRELTLSIDGASVGQVVAMGDAGSSRGLIDASAYGDDWMDYVVGQQDGDEVALEIALDPGDTGQGDLVTAYDAGTPSTFEMAHGSASFDVTFPALVTKLTRGGARDGLLHMLATLKILNPGVTDAT